MKISNIQFRKVFIEGKVRAIVSVVIDNQLAVHDIKIIKTAEKIFLAMPQTKGIGKDIVHPIDRKTREYMERKILTAFKEYLTHQPEI